MDTYGIAREWRVANDYQGRGGVIELFDGEVQGWVNALRNPEHWQTGCIAVDEDGHHWEAVGVGDTAREWRPLDE